MKHALVRDGEVVEFRHLTPNVDQSKLADGKPRWLPVVIQGYEPFDPATETRTGPIYAVDAERVVEEYTVTPKGTDEIAAMKSDKVAAIKLAAERRILDIMPAHRQMNWLAKATELTMKFGSDPAGWPDEWQQASRIVLDQWSNIGAIRSQSDILEARVLALETAAEVDAFDPNAGWTV